MTSLLKSIAAAELALRLLAHRGKGDWTALVVRGETGGDVETAAQDLLEEWSGLGADTATHLRATEPLALADQLSKAEGFVIVTGVDNWREEDWQHLDELRSRLIRTGRTALVLSTASFERLVTCAPNLSSLIPSAWHYLENPDRMSDEEKERRLIALREWSGMTDEEMLARREAGTLPPDPEHSLWLILLGRGDLLARERS
ncbi:MAG: hypothetical protein R3B70_25775 [Polyangiaceae bacterium]